MGDLNTGPAIERLDGWKNIAAHFQKDEATVRRWHRDQALPVYREAPTSRARVFAYASELDAWLDSRVVPSPAGPDAEVLVAPPAKASKVWYLAAIVVVVAAVGVARHYYRPPHSALRPEPARIFAASTSENASMSSVPSPISDPDIAASPDGSHVYVWRVYQRKAWRVEIPSGAAREIDLGHPLRDIQISKDSLTLYSTTGDGVRILDLRTNRAQEISVGAPPSELAISPNGEHIYAALGASGVADIHVPSRRVSTITTQPAPFCLALDPDGNRLFVSYRNGGPAGRDGHDSVEVFDLASNRPTTSTPGPPLVGGPLAYSPISGNVWVQMWDACYTPAYDHLGCPFPNATGYQIFRAQDMHLVATQAWPGRYVFPVLFSPRGSMAIVPGHPTRSVDARRLQTLEAIPLPSKHSAAAPISGRVILTSGDRLYYFDPTPENQLAPPRPYAQLFAFDGAFDDAIEKTRFRPEGNVEFVPGKVGQALRLHPASAIRMRSPSSERVGEEHAASVALWARPHGDSTVLSRESNIPWSLQCRSGRCELLAGEGAIGAKVQIGTWHHFVITGEHERFALYVDGVLAGTVSGSRQGKESGDYISKGYSDLDELSAFSGRLTPSEIQHLMDISAAPPK